jgi:hypothetical protein
LPSGQPLGWMCQGGDHRRLSLGICPSVGVLHCLKPSLEFNAAAGEDDLNREDGAVRDDPVAFHASSMAPLGWRSTWERGAVDAAHAGA